MSHGELQHLITGIVSSVLGKRAERGRSFNRFKNVHTPKDFGAYFPLIDRIFVNLGGNSKADKPIRSLSCDAYFGGPFNFILEIDERQHFGSARPKALELYPPDLQVGFDIQEYTAHCREHYLKADKCWRSKTTKDFDFSGGRTAQRAYLDCFRDILPTLHGLNPTVRISEFEVQGVTGNNTRSRLVVERALYGKLKRSCSQQLHCNSNHSASPWSIKH